MPAHSKIDITNRALALIGCDPIAAFDEGSMESNTAGQLYDAVVEELITLHDWAFAIYDRQLTATEDVSPSLPWETAFLLPADCLQERVLTLNGEAVDFERHGLYLYTTLTEDDLPILEYFIRPTEQVFTPVFRQLLQYKLAMDFALAIARSAPLSEECERKYNTQLAISTFQNSINRKNRRVEANALRGYR